jgi:SAM-dependent methyltransferase
MGTQTHEIVLIKPKPTSAEIIRLTSEYFDAKGREYDTFEMSTQKRDLFTEKVNKLIALAYSSDSTISNILSIACGTGRRECEIKELTGKNLSFTGIEISVEMCKLAAKRGIHVTQGSWIEIPPLKTKFDSALLLSSFGHVPSQSERLAFLSKISSHLKDGASLFLDVLNIEDESEWGPNIEELFLSENMKSHGFDRGDVLYRKIGEPELCFYHYFSTKELENLLHSAGFIVSNLWYIGYGESYGEIQTSSTRGAIFIKATKK